MEKKFLYDNPDAEGPRPARIARGKRIASRREGEERRERGEGGNRIRRIVGRAGR